MGKLMALSMLTGVFLWPLGMIGGGSDAESYIKVEIKGIIETGIVAIGGETTGTVIRVKNVTWELDLGGNPELRALAEKFNKQTVLVTGAYQKIRGVEIPERHIVKVSGLKLP